MPTPPLSDADITRSLAQLHAWSREGDKLVKTFKLPSYAAGLMFASAVGTVADSFDHHPDLFIGYKTVRVEFTTHDAGHKISQKDVDVASAVDQLPYRKDK